MTLLEISIIAFALCADAFSISLVFGLNTRSNYIYTGVKIALLFGLIQAFLYFIGNLSGHFANDYILSITGQNQLKLINIVPCIVLLIIGFKMFKEKSDENLVLESNLRSIFLLGVSVSIDALATGVSLGSAYGFKIIDSFIVFIITLILSFTGVIITKMINDNSFFIKNSTKVGGIVLMLIGLKLVLF